MLSPHACITALPLLHCLCHFLITMLSLLHYYSHHCSPISVLSSPHSHCCFPIALPCHYNLPCCLPVAAHLLLCSHLIAALPLLHSYCYHFPILAAALPALLLLPSFCSILLSVLLSSL